MQKKVSEYIGVSKNSISGHWFARITYDGRSKHLGTFPTEIDAAEGYNKASKMYYGRRAKLNIIDRGEQ